MEIKQIAFEMISKKYYVSKAMLSDNLINQNFRFHLSISFQTLEISNRKSLALSIYD